ncbi:MAG: Gfo/Idh/MocA family protein, partial [Hyphomicrobiaceae bacterium]
GVKTQVGFNYLANPMFLLARDMVRSGELGDIRSYRGIHAEDYMADSATPFGWRHDPTGGGVLADLGSHALATAEFIVGRISQVLGDLRTHITARPGADNSLCDIEVDDVARAFLRFENGASGSIEANWIATGRKMQHDFEVHGSKGALIFSQERLNELKYYDTRNAAGRHGFRTIVAGPEHAPYGQFCVAPGHQLGFNDLKAIEVAGYINAIAGLAPEPFNFRSGLRVQELVESIQASARSGVWTGAPTVN